MGIELSGIGVKMRKGVVFTIRGGFRSVCNHPFVVIVLCFLIFLHRSCPFVFSLLVSASPVLVCTAVLLGTLLSFGQQNIPEIETEEKTSYRSVSIRAGVSGDVTGVEKEEKCNIERNGEKRRDEGDQFIEDRRFSAGKLGGSRRGNSVDDTVPLIEESYRDTEVKNGKIWEASRDLDVMWSKQKAEWNENKLGDREAMENHYATISKLNGDDHLESDDEKSETDSFDSERVNVDSLDSPPRSPWKRVDGRKEEEDEVEDDALESESDGADSSSPDASMTDIMPMLDELHPLLDEEAPHPVNDESDRSSKMSSKSSTSHDSDEGTENNEDLEAAHEGIEDGEDEEEERGNKEEKMNSAITWTEEDQKNLMDLGSSEIERNQRLENLILRRRSRKNMSMVPERNLIDLENFDLGLNIAPISTARQNPFDLPRDSYDHLGIPPIPGSAPSILLPRRNPFDIPYDSSEEKPNLMGDGFQEEFSSSHSREPFFRRNETFNVGPSIFAQARLEKQDVKMRPYFVTERMASEESSYSRFHRQSSELSDSKVSSVPETDSIDSVDDLEGGKLSEEDSAPDAEGIIGMKEAIIDVPSGEQELISSREEVSEKCVPELISEMEHVSEHVGHGSQSSEEDGSIVLGQTEKNDVEVDALEFQLEDVEDVHEKRSVVNHLDAKLNGRHSNSEAIEQKLSRGSSSSSLSEISERVFNETGGEQISMLERRDNVVEQPEISTRTFLGRTDISITLVENIPQREPVYDSSPPADMKNLFSSSMSSDMHTESDLDLPPVLVKQTITSIERESEGCSQGNDGIPINMAISSKPLTRNPASEHESEQTYGVNKQQPDDITSGLSGVDQRLGSSVEASREENIMNNHRECQDPSSSFAKKFHRLVKSSEDGNLCHSDKGKHLPISEKESVPTLEGELTRNHSIEKEETVESPNSDCDIYHEAREKLISTPTAEGNVPLFYDKALHKQIFKRLNEVQIPNTQFESVEKCKTVENIRIQEVREFDPHISPNPNSPLLSPDFISIPSSDSEGISPHIEIQTIIEEEDGIKDIDEELLCELDSIGDFNVNQWEPAPNELEKHIDSVSESLRSTHPAETSITRIVEVNPVEVNIIENAVHSGNLREEIDIHEEEIECLSESLEIGVAGSVDIAKNESNERDLRDSEILEEEMILSEEDDVEASDSVGNQTYQENNISGISEVEMEAGEDVDVLSEKAELKKVETETIILADTSHQSQVNINTTPEMLVSEDKIRAAEDNILDHKKVGDASGDNHIHPGSQDQILHSVGSAETLGISSEASGAGIGDRSTKGRADQEDSSVDKESSRKDISTIDTETQGRETESHKNLHSIKIKSSNSRSSSSSSSSSDSSSGDSDSD